MLDLFKFRSDVCLFLTDMLLICFMFGAKPSFAEVDLPASDYKEKGIKTLEMVNEEGRWKIFRESWKKN